MAIKVKSVDILDNTLVSPITRLTAVLGMHVDKLNVRVVLDGPAADLPAQVELEAIAQEPKLRRAGKGSMSKPLALSAKRQGTSAEYIGSTPLSALAPFMKSSDNLLEVATVVRHGGTSDKKFREPLTKAGWAVRGTSIQPDIGKNDSTGSIANEQPDAKTLFWSGGVEVLEVSVVDKSLTLGKNSKSWAFVRSPADVFFYSGHGAWWNCQLLREAPNHRYWDWLGPNDLLPSWKRTPDLNNSPFDLDVLIINGCSVLLWDRLGFYTGSPDPVPSCALKWRELFHSRQGPLVVILGYRDTAPWDDPWGDRIAGEMAQAIANGLGKSFDKYARAWLEINAKYKPTWTAAAIDQKGYSYINMKQIYDNKIKDYRDMDGYDPKHKDGFILGPFGLP